MNKFFFTFGTDPLFPFSQNDYVVVIAPNIDEAQAIFDKHYPPRIPGLGLSNCAFIYTEGEFEKFRGQYYKGVAPIKVLGGHG